MATRNSKKAAKAAAPPDAAPKTHWTRAEAEAHVRGLNLRCQGPRDEAKLAEWQRLMDKGKVEEARAIQTRTGCSNDFSATVIAQPFDGADHETPCPKCGVVTSWKSPVFDGLDESRKRKG